MTVKQNEKEGLETYNVARHFAEMITGEETLNPIKLHVGEPGSGMSMANMSLMWNTSLYLADRLQGDLTRWREYFPHPTDGARLQAHLRALQTKPIGGYPCATCPMCPLKFGKDWMTSMNTPNLAALEVMRDDRPAIAITVQKPRGGRPL